MQNDSYQEQDSFRNENVLKLTMVMVAQPSEYTKDLPENFKFFMLMLTTFS